MPAKVRYIDSDIVRVYTFGSEKKNKDSYICTLFWGDSVRVVGKSGGQHKLEFARRSWDPKSRHYQWNKVVGVVSGSVRFRDDPILKVRFVDVGQGDAAIIESPKGRVILLDGGEENHLKNYVTAAWAHVLRTRPLNCDAVVVTHGDADHFSGLPRLAAQTRRDGKSVITVDRVFHNGIVKRPDSVPEKSRLGRTRVVDGETYLTELEEDLLTTADSKMNTKFLEWKTAIRQLKKENSKLRVRRLQYGDNDAFSFLSDENVKVEVLGPVVSMLGSVPALPALSAPGSSSFSSSHTINGHSIVLKLTYGNVRFLFGADLNAESEETLLKRTRSDNVSLAAEVLKVPHHGSADFSPAILEAIRPVVSVVSSGDENAVKEYIHPRAGLVGALGKYSRPTVDKPLIYVTEMVAFFARLGRISAHKFSKGDKESATGREINNAYEKTSFGIVHIRTDGQRVLVATHSGKPKDKESYVFTVSELGDVEFGEEPSIL